MYLSNLPFSSAAAPWDAPFKKLALCLALLAVPVLLFGLSQKTLSPFMILIAIALCAPIGLITILNLSLRLFGHKLYYFKPDQGQSLWKRDLRTKEVTQCPRERYDLDDKRYEFFMLKQETRIRHRYSIKGREGTCPADFTVRFAETPITPKAALAFYVWFKGIPETCAQGVEIWNYLYQRHPSRPFSVDIYTAGSPPLSTAPLRPPPSATPQAGHSS